MNKRGTPANLVRAQPGNLNAVKYGQHSERLVLARAEELRSELALGEVSPLGRLAVHELCRWMAIAEAIDRDIDDRGVVDRRGKARGILAERARASRHVQKWLEIALNEIEERATVPEGRKPMTKDEIRHDLERIASTAKNPRHRLTALRILAEDTKRDPGFVTIRFKTDGTTEWTEGEDDPVED